MQLTTIRNRIRTEFESVREVEANGDFFFMYREEEKFPFATIVTSDNDFDSVSNLDRDGFYRLNIGIDKPIFQHLFGSIPSKPGIGGYTGSGIDFTREDTLFPHPFYGTMYWVSIVNPSEGSYPQLKGFLDYAYGKAKASYEKANPAP
ncbi:hypothetical protein SAMN04487996_113136 [Dyadobacter soli]|uniref:DUF6194 domain-containing protein n=1 Tax=Dyadobacter soli TaxID=659014 RepID=A0A1G7PV79_9BACT|nr:DUF6194 family protein [Dyadobacter soli]SDF90115.1 hypothetical protein SAMN04487996_113136 [Dyadobacter soli]